MSLRERTGEHYTSSRPRPLPKCHNFDPETGQRRRPFCAPGCRFTHPDNPDWPYAAASGPTAYDKRPNVKCANFDSDTGERRRPCKPDCSFIHPDDPRWATAAISKLAARNLNKGPGAANERDGGWTTKGYPDRRPRRDSGVSAGRRDSKDSTDGDKEAHAPSESRRDSTLTGWGALAPNTAPNTGSGEAGWGGWGEPTLNTKAAEDGWGGWGTPSKVVPTDAGGWWSMDSKKDGDQSANPPSAATSKMAPPLPPQTSSKLPSNGWESPLEPEPEMGPGRLDPPDVVMSDAQPLAPSDPDPTASKPSFGAHSRTASIESNEANELKGPWKSSFTTLPATVAPSAPSSISGTRSFTLSKPPRVNELRDSTPSSISRLSFFDDLRSRTQSPAATHVPSERQTTHTIKPARTSTSMSKAISKSMTDPASNIVPIHANKSVDDDAVMITSETNAKPALTIVPPSKSSVMEPSQNTSITPIYQTPATSLPLPMSATVRNFSAMSQMSSVSFTHSSIQKMFQTPTEKAWKERIDMLQKSVRSNLELLKLQQVQKDRQELAAMLRNKLHLPATSLPIPSTMVQREDAEIARVQQKLKVEVESLSETQQTQDHWWPTPNLAIEYGAAIASLEADVRNTEETIKNSQPQTDVMEIEKEEAERVNLQLPISLTVSEKEEPRKASEFQKVDTIEKVEQEEINLGDLETLVGETTELLDNTSELVRTKIEVASEEVKTYLEDMYPQRASQAEEAARQKRAADLLKRYSALGNRMSGYLVKLADQQSEKVGRQEELKKATARLENLLEEQMQMATRYKKMAQEANNLSTQPTFSQRVEAVCTGKAVEERCMKELVPRLLELGHSYRKEDEKYLANSHNSLQAKITELYEMSERNNQQRAQIISESLKNNHTLHVLNRVGLTIDQRWNDIVSTKAAATVATQP